MKTYPTQVECTDDDDDLVFIVNTVDRHCAIIDLKQCAHSPKSLETLFVELRKAFQILELTP
jgi:hypothetical protein